MSEQNRRVEREAAEWYARLSSGRRLEVRQFQDFEAWIAADQHHQTHYAEVTATMSALSSLQGHPDIAALRLEANQLRQKQAPRRRAQCALAIGGSAIAATLAVIVAIHNMAVERLTVQTGPGELRHVTLGDGTQAWIGSDSRLEVAYARDRRDVAVARGEAFFDVAENKQRPFVVSAADRAVTAHGTAFDVRLYGSDFVVTLLRGTVGVSRLKSEDLVETTLHPGQQYGLSGGIAVVRDVDAAAQVAWHEGIIQLNDSSLGEAVVTFNRNSLVKLVIGDERLSALRVSGTFRTGSANDFSHALETALPVVAVRQSSGDILLKHR